MKRSLFMLLAINVLCSAQTASAAEPELQWEWCGSSWPASKFVKNAASLYWSGAQVLVNSPLSKEEREYFLICMIAAHDDCEIYQRMVSGVAGAYWRAIAAVAQDPLSDTSWLNAQNSLELARGLVEDISRDLTPRYAGR